MMLATLLTVPVVAPASGQNAGRARIPGIQVHNVLEEIPVSVHAVNLVSTPVALCNGRIIVVSVEEGARSPNRLLTVARSGERSNGEWQWRRTVIEERTLPDDYHTQPSVGVDRRGHVHIAYNMHNMPWQYAVSREPCSIDGFEFRGQPVSDAELHEVFERNRTPFPDAGTAAIPGNQITYPAFFNDRNGDLYVTYRFAVRPARPWLERAFGAGMARFDSDAGKWTAIGGEVPLTGGDAQSQPPEKPSSAQPFAWEPGWTVYPLRLWFDRYNRMHAAWTWRSKQAGIDTSNPSYAGRLAPSENFTRADGSEYAMPIKLADAGVIELPQAGQKFFAGIAVTTDSNGPLVLLQPVDAPRILASYDRATRKWAVQGPSPYGATSVICEDDATCWAYASGPRVLVRARGSTQWRVAFEGEGYCDPKPLHDFRTGRRFLYITRCDQRAARVIELAGSPRL